MALPTFLLEKTPWEHEKNPIWPASTLTLHRNVSRYDFPSKLSNQKAETLIQELQKTLYGIKEIKFPLALHAPELTPLAKEFLFEHFLFLEGFAETLDGQAFALDSTAEILLLFNQEDHLQLHLLDSNCDLDSSYNRLIHLENNFGATLGFAFHPRFGYLTADPGLAGTGLIVNTFLHVPALIHTGGLEEILESELTHEVVPTSLEAGSYPADLLVLTNLYTLGVSEEHTLQTLHAATLKIMAKEEQLRTHPDISLKNSISRAYGLLLYSYHLETEEALSALSLLKLAFHLGWIEGVTEKSLNELLFKCRKAHLSHLHPASENLDRTRAIFLQESLKGLKLKA